MPSVAVIENVVRRCTKLFTDPFTRQNVCHHRSWLCFQLAEMLNGHSDPWKQRPFPLGQWLEVSSSRCTECHLLSLCCLLEPPGPGHPVWNCLTLLSPSWRAGAVPVGQPGGLWGNLVVPASMSDCRQCLERSSMGNCLFSGLLELRLLPGHSSSALKELGS